MTADCFKIAVVVDKSASRGPINQLLKSLRTCPQQFDISVVAVHPDQQPKNPGALLPRAIFKTLPTITSVKQLINLLALRLMFSFELSIVAKRRQYKWLTNDDNLNLTTAFNPGEVFDAVIWLSRCDPHMAAPQVNGDRLQLSFGPSPELFAPSHKRQDSVDFSISLTSQGNGHSRKVISGSIMSANRWLLTHANLTLKAHAFLIKLICERSKNGAWAQRQPPSGHADTPEYAYVPRLRDVGNYALQTLFAHPLRKFWEKSVRRRAPIWSISVMKGDGLASDMSKAERVTNPQRRFLADPFVIQVQGQHYCFAEDFFADEKKGKISVLHLSESGVSEPEVVLDEDVHLSFPFVFNHGDDVFMIPETSGAKQIRLYKAHNFPHDWRLHKVIIDHVDAADTVVFEKNGRWYLLTNICSASRADHQSELHLFSATDLVTDTWVPANNNPIMFDSKKARNAGFFKRGDKFFRVNQVQARAQYGYAFEINEITDISPDSYSETCVKRVEPQTQNGMMRTHHYHYNGDYTVFDHSYVDKR